MKVDSIRKIGYSFLGLLAGIAALLVGTLLIFLLPVPSKLVDLRHVWNLRLSDALAMSAIFAIVSMVAWTVVGLPFVLLLRAVFVARLHWLLDVLIGALLGVSTLALIFLAITRDAFKTATMRAPGYFWQYVAFLSVAALIPAVAFPVYCSLVRHALCSQEIKSGAPSGTP